MSLIIPSPIPDLEYGGTTCPISDGFGVGKIEEGSGSSPGANNFPCIPFYITTTYSFIRTVTRNCTGVNPGGTNAGIPFFTRFSFYIGGCPRNVTLDITASISAGVYLNSEIIIPGEPTLTASDSGSGTLSVTLNKVYSFTGPCPVLVQLYVYGLASFTGSFPFTPPTVDLTLSVA